MKTRPVRTIALIAMIGVFFFQMQISTAQTAVPLPEEYFGFVPGSDRNLFHYEELVEYLKKIDQASDRLKMVEIGKSPMGKPMYIAFISSAANIARLDELKEINRKLALDVSLSDSDRDQLINKGKVFFLATLSMHSTEVAPSQAAPLIAYKLVTTSDPGILAWLDDVVYMMVPCHNPDGMDMVVDNYLKYKGTKYEGSSLPGVYHKYVGHDNNRDFVTLSQEDNQAISRIYSTEWFPQVMVEKHQMGSTGIRYFVPPMHDPIAENVEAELWNWTGIFGTNMIKDMTRDGLAGVGQRTIFDDYWPGSTETCIWKNVIGFLTEAASAQVATPIFIEPNELTVRGKGLSEYKKSINMPWPWPGGWWRLGDIVQYEITSTFSILKTAHLHRADILRFRNDMARKEVEKGRSEPPYYYIMPAEQHDRTELAGIVNLLGEHGIQVFSLGKDIVLNDRIYKKGDVVVPLAQPFRAFIKEVMEKQEYPVRHYTPDGEVIRPYDITSWSLPLHRGVSSFEINERSLELENHLQPVTGHYAILKGTPAFPALFTVNENGSFRAAFLALQKGLKVYRTKSAVRYDGKEYPEGSFLVEGKDPAVLEELVKEAGASPAYGIAWEKEEVSPLSLPRIGLVETWFHDTDAGWTRYIFDTYHIPFTVIHPADLEKADLKKQYDVIIFPDENKSILMQGKSQVGDQYYATSYPPEYAKGMGKKGLNNLLTFVDGGGLVLAWGGSVDLFTGPLEISRSENDKDDFQLPFRNIGSSLRKEGLVCPGSLIRVRLTPVHGLTLGMPEETGVFYRGDVAFQTSVPVFDTDRRTVAVFPEKELLLSGYIEKDELIGNKTAMVWLRKGKGQLVLYAFNPQFRASTQGNYKLLFNGLLLK